MTISSWSLIRPPPAVLDLILQVINIADKRYVIMAAWRHRSAGNGPNGRLGSGVPRPDTRPEGDSALAGFSPRDGDWRELINRSVQVRKEVARASP
jgi:hypothetical protein